MIKGNALVGQTGGPTCVINASLQGLILQSLASPDTIETLYGMRFGFEGLLEGKLSNLSTQSKHVINGLSHTPSSALGSSRYKLQDKDLPRIAEALKKAHIRYLFLIGGNDSMDSIHRVEKYCRKNDYTIQAIGIPKTVDNDLFGTHYSPGYPSAARYNALSLQQSGRLARDMRQVDHYVIYQSIGRDAGWLSAATALARQQEGDPPHLIYCPERPFIKENFISDSQDCISKYGYVSIVVSEGVLYPDGSPLSAAQGKDPFGNTEYGAMSGSSAALSLHQILSKATGLRGEFQITESLPMCAMDRAESQDIARARDCGREALRLALAGETGYMVSIIQKQSADHALSLGKIPLNQVAIRAKEMPAEMINNRGNNVTEAFLRYLRPLVGDLPDYVSLE